MSVHFEWEGVEGCAINFVPESFNVDRWEQDMSGDDPRRTTYGPSVILGADSGLVITADRPDQLTEFARTLLRMAEDFEREQQT